MTNDIPHPSLTIQQCIQVCVHPSPFPHASPTTTLPHTQHTHTHTHALTEAVVLYDREKEDDDELSGEMGDVITDVKKVSGPHFKTTIYGTCWTYSVSKFLHVLSALSNPLIPCPLCLSHVSTHSPDNISTDSLMDGLRECSMKDEDYFQATMFDFQEVQILHSHFVYYNNHVYSLFTTCTLCEMYLSVDQPCSQVCLKEPGNEVVS